MQFLSVPIIDLDVPENSLFDGILQQDVYTHITSHSPALSFAWICEGSALDLPAGHSVDPAGRRFVDSVLD
jgi:hypothetical protein